jgi:dipeptidyl aminopeptidase/acylaminoacyl peptidase
VHERVAGGERESIFQPAWSPAGELHFVSDRSGFWNLYRQPKDTAPAQSLCPRAAEFGAPQWGFGMTTYGFAEDGRIICAFTENGTWRMAALDSKTGELRPYDLPYTTISMSCAVRVDGRRAVFVAGSPTETDCVVELDLERGKTQILRRSAATRIDPGYVSIPEAIEFPTVAGQTAHAFYYPPANRDFEAPLGTRPPLLVLCHGGPTSAVWSTLDLKLQFWTSRGFAIAEVNYGGSTGYGRAYRERLEGQWGVVDVDDCEAAAQALVARGAADPAKLAIAGGSSGGYTVLCALAFRDVFRAGASHYGVSDLETLARDTHKFESRYLDRLVGPYPAARELYIERSPVHHADRIRRPVIFFQGLEDPIVPPNQAERMVAALKERGVPTAYLSFPGEQHGLRRAESITRMLDAELAFYGRVFGFTPADPIAPFPIENAALLAAPPAAAAATPPRR